MPKTAVVHAPVLSHTPVRKTFPAHVARPRSVTPVRFMLAPSRSSTPGRVGAHSARPHLGGSSDFEG
eukprot:948000-Amphidinium_carterae.1